MKNTFLLIAISFLLVGIPSIANAQTKKESDYNLRKAYELLENKEEAEALKSTSSNIHSIGGEQSSIRTWI